MNRAVIPALLLFSCAVLRADEYSDLFREAAALTQHRQYTEAITKYKAALRIRPASPEALNNLAVMYYQVGRYREALDAASIWNAHPELKSAALIAGMSAVRCNRPKEALAPLQHLLESDPANRDALLALASAHVALHDLRAAADLYEKQIGATPNDVMAWYGRAICFEQMAEAACRQLSRMPGGTGYSKRLLGEYLQSEGDTLLAREAFGEAVESSGAVSPHVLRQYETARELAQKSRESFEKLVAIAPGSWQTEIFLGDVDRQHGQLQSAISHYQKAADLQPGNPGALLGLGTAYWELGDFEHAGTYLRQSLNANPDASQPLFELANIAVRRHSEAEAIPLLKQYLSRQPDALAAHADLGRAYLHLGKYADAVSELSQAASADERGDVHYQLSVALRKLGRNAEADEALNQSNAIRTAQLRLEQKLHTKQ